MLLEYINRSRAVIKLLGMKQGFQWAQDYITEVKDQAILARANTVRITEGVFTRIALIRGIQNRLLTKKVLTKNINLKNIVSLKIQKENSKANTHARTDGAENRVRRLLGGSRYKQQGASNSDNHSLTLDNMKRQQRRLDVLKVQRHGKYSSRYKSESNAGRHEVRKKCKDSDLRHKAGNCRTRRKTFFNCNGVGH